MYRSLLFGVALLAFVFLEGRAIAQESSVTDFKEFCKATEGHWQGTITLWQDLPGIGKKSDEKTVDWVFNLAVDGNGLVGHASDDSQGSAVSLTYYDVEKRQIKGVIVYSGATVARYVVSKQSAEKWGRLITSANPDGTKSEASDTLVISDGGKTHTWTRDDKPLKWRRLSE